MSILIFIISLAILILVHELGHFLAAKKFGIRVDEFGLGLPPRAWGKKLGETIYSLNWIPFGGFVKIFGEDPEDEAKDRVSPDADPVIDSNRAMYRKPKWIQAIVLVAGVTFNVIFAWILISAGFMMGLPAPVTDAPEVRDARVVVVSVVPNSPAFKAGLRSGDTLVSVVTNARSLQGNDLTPDNVSTIISVGEGSVGVIYKRGKSAPQTVLVEPSGSIAPGRRAIGITMEKVGTLQLSFFPALIRGARTTFDMTLATARGLGSFLAGIFTFHSDLSQVTGPVGLAGVVGEASELGFVYLLSLMALISINLAVINLIPFPALDGGRLLFIGIEAIIRRPIKPAVVRWTNTVGFFLLILLMLVITGHDILKLL